MDQTTPPSVEGPARTRDYSFPYLQKFEALQEAEKGIPMAQFYPIMKIRDLDLEFRLLKKITETKEHAGLLCENSPETMSENRYPDVLPYRDTLVQLNSGAYINADFVDGSISETENLFIVTQGPMSGTLRKFWDMIWEYDVSLVVMACQMYEGGQEKCEPYFPLQPENSSLKIGPYTIELVKMKEKRPGLLLRRLMVRHEDSERVLGVDHLQATTWPDQGSPDLDMEVESLNYLIYYMEKRTIPGQKLLVHCSAGCGRSGAIVGLYCMVTALESLIKEDSSPRVSVFGTVRRLREQRWGLVQTKEQYTFMYHYMESWITAYLSRRAYEDEELGDF